ncbi:MAG TPA: hypothetical protein VM491_15390, partial [Burkholderiaceae bacterium]|nr:hypothetical protein [Burkholderiaceae bacterium]
MKKLILALIGANLLALLWLSGWLPFASDGREPARVGQQIQADSLRVVPLSRALPPRPPAPPPRPAVNAAADAPPAPAAPPPEAAAAGA